jgi:bla regulator protein blaR1
MTRMHLLCSAVLSVCVVLPQAAAAQQTPAVQAQPAPSTAHKLEFDAVSVRPGRKFFLKGSEFLDPVSKMAPPPGGLFSWNVQLVNLIDFAYDLRDSQLRRQAFQGLPRPFNTMQDGWFAIEARAEGNPTRDAVSQMVRSMLEERFHFAAHMEKRDGDLLALEVDKPGLLKPHTEGEPCTLPSSVTDSRKYPHAYPPYEGFPVRCGVFNRELSHSGERRLEMLDVTMEQIANALSGMEPAAVVDQSGLEGHYDAVLDFGPRLPPSAEAADDTVGAPQLPTALEKQLGLKLVKQKAQVDMFVIDHVEPPTEN